MGHRVSANLFRVGLSRTWNSHWFAKSEYTYLLSLDYRVRDFIDFIFYNLKWPTSELQIRRFLSRSVILELLISIPDDRLVYFLNFTKFLGNLCITGKIDSFKFNGLLFEYNYVLSSFAYNILGKSIFFLLLQQHKLNTSYDWSLSMNLYRNLFHLSFSDSVKNNNPQLRRSTNSNIYLFKKKKVCIKSRFFNGLSKKRFNRLGLKKGVSKHFLFDLLNLFTETPNGKLYVSKYNKYLLYLNDLVKVRNIRRRTSYQIHKLLFNCINAKNKKENLNTSYFSRIYSEYFEQINKTIKYLIYKYSKYNPYVLLSSYSQIKKFINKDSNFFKYLSNVANVKKCKVHNLNFQSLVSNNLISFMKYVVYLNNCLPVKRFNIISVLLFIYSISELLKGIFIDDNHLLFCNKLGMVELPIMNKQSAFGIFSEYTKLYSSGCNYASKNKFDLLKKIELNNKNLKDQLFLISNNFPIFLWQKWKTIIRKKSTYKTYSGIKINKNTRKLIFRQKDIIFKRDQIFNKSVKQNKKKFFVGSYNSTMSEAFNHFGKDQFNKNILSKTNVIKKDNSKNISFKGQYDDENENVCSIKRNKSKFVSSANSCILKMRKKKFNTVFFSDFRRLVYPFLLRNTHFFKGSARTFKYGAASVYVDIVTYFIRMYYSNRNLFHRYSAIKSKLLRLSNEVELNDILLLYNPTSLLYYYTRISFFFDSLWYFNVGASYLKKLLLLAKYKKYYLRTSFAVVYQNLYSVFMFRKFFNFFNYLKLENTVFVNIKFFRFFKKLFFDIKKKFLKKSILLFIIFIYSYLNMRFSRVQLFIRNLLTIFIKNDLSTERFSAFRQSSVYIFLYYFYNHLKLSIFIIRILQLFITFAASILPIKSTKLVNYLQTSIGVPHRCYRRTELRYTNMFKYKKVSLYVQRMHALQSNIVTNLQRHLSNTTLPIIMSKSYSLFIKLIPDFVRSPYYIIDRSTAFYDIDSISSNTLPHVTVPLEETTSTIVYPIVFSKQWKQILSKKRPYFFRYVVNRLIYYLDNIRRDSIPIQSLQFFSIIIEYNLSIYLKNVVVFMPIYYLSKRVPFYQAKLICLYVSYELEKGIPYFLVLKQIIIHNRIRHTRRQKRFPIKNLNNILGQKIFTADDRFSQLTNFEFITKYQREWQSKTIFKYFIFRSFYSLGTVRKFKHKLGLRISCSGRMYRRQTRSHTMWFVEGALPLRSFEKYIEFYSSFAITNLGAVGVKVWSFLVQIPILS